MINPNGEKTTAVLKAIHEELSVKAKELGCELRWVEVKGTVYFFPQLPALE